WVTLQRRHHHPVRLNRRPQRHHKAPPLLVVASRHRGDSRLLVRVSERHRLQTGELHAIEAQASGRVRRNHARTNSHTERIELGLHRRRVLSFRVLRGRVLDPALVATSSNLLHKRRYGRCALLGLEPNNLLTRETGHLWTNLSLREPRNGRCELRERVRLSSRRRKSRVGVLRRHVPQLLRHLRQAITEHHSHARRIRRTTTPRTIRVPREDDQVFLRRVDRLSRRRVVLHDPQRVQRQALIASERRRPHPQQINMRLRRL